MLTDAMAVLLFAIVSQARPTNLSTDRFKYTCPMRYTESDPPCGWLGLKLAGPLRVYSGDYAAAFNRNNAYGV